ncbi:MAG: ABC transporter substrate-binding protein [Bacilli bacterium]|jgi:NitT/TauT family transport system substrate-binding protein
MKKILLSFLGLCLLVLGLSACSTTKEEVKIGFLKGPTGMGAAYLMAQNEDKKTKNIYDFTIAGAVDELTGRLISGDLDMAALPTNLIATLNSKTDGEIQILGVNTLGVLYIIENGSTINSLADLEGKTILASGKGSTAEHILNYILVENEVTVEMVWASEHSEAATQLLNGNYTIAMLPEPFVTTVTSKDQNFKVAINLSEEWGKLDVGELMMGGIAVRKTFVQEHEQAVKNFVKEYQSSVNYVNKNLKAAADLIEKYDIAKASVAEAALPRCNIVWKHGTSYKEPLTNFLGVLYAAKPMSVGGKLPTADFYLNY